MYEKPELTLVATAADVVLGVVFEGDDSDGIPQELAEGLVAGLDD